MLYSASAVSEPGCHDADIISSKLITDICWDCVFPIRIAGVAMKKYGQNANDYYGGRAPSDAVGSPYCQCEDDLGMLHPGITMSMWEPARLIEFQRVPGCSSVFNGMRFPFDRANQGHHQRGGKPGMQGTFMHYHYYAFPLFAMLNLFTNVGCNVDGYMDLDIMYLSELDPTWNNDELAFFTIPEAAAVSSSTATLACIQDAVSSNAGYPINSLFWCAGSWGQIYPLSGSQYTMSGILENTSLLTTKVLTSLHRRGLAHRSMGDDAMCHGKIDVTLRAC
ncbi:MAG: TraU family protein [Candidatus Thiodiazotropha endolucinida]